MAFWQELTEPEYEEVWKRFYYKYDFHPSVDPIHWPGITEPKPSVTYKISQVYGSDKYETLVTDLNARMLEAFRLSTSRKDKLYALDWQHTCYRFDPHLRFEPGDPNNWWVPVLPNGDYAIFLSQDMKLGIFGHPWEETICVFGKSLLQAVEKRIPLLFNTVVRINGETV